MIPSTIRHNAIYFIKAVLKKHFGSDVAIQITTSPEVFFEAVCCMSINGITITATIPKHLTITEDIINYVLDDVFNNHPELLI